MFGIDREISENHVRRLRDTGTGSDTLSIRITNFQTYISV